MPEPHREHELARLEAALKGLRPAPAALDRDRLMYRAGQRSPRLPLWRWTVFAAAAGVLVGVATAFPLVRLTTPPIERVIVRVADPPRPALVARPDNPEKAPEAPPSRPEVQGLALFFPTPSGGYLRLRDQVIRFGLDALPSPVVDADARPNAPTTLLRMYESLADEKSETGGE